MAEACLGTVARGCSSLLHQAGAPNARWTDTIHFCTEMRNRLRRNIGDHAHEALLLEFREHDERIELLPEWDCVEFWPPWSCQAIALISAAASDDKPAHVAVIDVSLDTTKRF